MINCANMAQFLLNKSGELLEEGGRYLMQLEDGSYVFVDKANAAEVLDNGTIENNSEPITTDDLGERIDGSLVSVDQKLITKVFRTQFEESIFEDRGELHNESLLNNDASIEDDVLSPIENTQTNWSRENILKLITLYKKKQELFKNTTVRNDKVWGIIAKDLNYTLEQCKNKFKYLKAKYVKVKDSMSDRNTGGKKITFDYFGEFEEIFGKDPNIEPVAIASCSGLNKKQTPSDEQNNNTRAHQIEMPTEESTPKKQKTSVPAKGKKILFAKELKDLSEVMKEREANRERRHQEMMRKKEETIAAFNKYISFLINKEKDT